MKASSTLFPLLVARRWRGLGSVRRQALVRKGLDPDRFDERLAELAVRVSRRAEIDREDPLGPALDQPQASVRGDRVEPGAQRAAALEPADRAPGAQHRLLHRVLGIVQGAEHPVGVRLELAAVGREQALEGVLVTAAGGG